MNNFHELIFAPVKADDSCCYKVVSWSEEQQRYNDMPVNGRVELLEKRFVFTGDELEKVIQDYEKFKNNGMQRRVAAPPFQNRNSKFLPKDFIVTLRSHQ